MRKKDIFKAILIEVNGSYSTYSSRR